MGLVAIQQALGDGRAQTLQRLIGPLLGDEAHGLADLAVIDCVLYPIGDRRIALADVYPDVEQQPLADFALSGRDTDVGEQRQPADLDRYLGLGALLVLVLVPALLELVGLVHGALTVAAVTASASCTGATSWTRNTRAPAR